MFIQMWVVNIIATWLIKLAIPDIDTLAKTNMASENAPPPPLQKEILSLETIIFAVYVCEFWRMKPSLTAT